MPRPTQHGLGLPESLSVERLEPRYALSALSLSLPSLLQAPVVTSVVNNLAAETTSLLSSPAGAGVTGGLGSLAQVSTDISLGGLTSGNLLGSGGPLGAGANVSLLGQNVGVGLQAGGGTGPLGLLDGGLQVAVAAPLGVQANLNVGLGGSTGLLDVGLGASVGQLVQANLGVGVGAGELLGLSVGAGGLGDGAGLNIDLGAGSSGVWGGFDLGDTVSGGFGAGFENLGIPAAPGSPGFGFVNELPPALSAASVAGVDGSGTLVDTDDEEELAAESEDVIVGAPGDDELLESLVPLKERSVDSGGSGTDDVRAATTMGDSVLMGRALPMLLAPNLAAHGIPQIAADLVEMAAVANAAELAAFESALAQFLGELEALQAEMAAADLGLVPWILTASVATIAAGEIVRRERRARRSRPQPGNAPPGLCLA
jgi:hypothetical protein